MGQNKIGDMDVMLKLDNRGPHYILKTETTSIYLFIKDIFFSFI